jgi:hypothetical protein
LRTMLVQGAHYILGPLPAALFEAQQRCCAGSHAQNAGAFVWFRAAIVSEWSITLPGRQSATNNVTPPPPERTLTARSLS